MVAGTLANVRATISDLLLTELRLCHLGCRLYIDYL